MARSEESHLLLQEATLDGPEDDLVRSSLTPPPPPPPQSRPTLQRSPPPPHTFTPPTDTFTNWHGQVGWCPRNNGPHLAA